MPSHRCFPHQCLADSGLAAATHMPLCSEKMLRKQLEAEFNVDLTEKKKLIREEVGRRV